ncbi:DNA polymerase delta subunit 3 [Linum perenne]
METLGILEDVETLVSDKNQVVSYKWLSRNFLVPSNDAKRLLQDFVDKRGSHLDVVYTVSGWLNKNPPSYKVRLVSGLKLEGNISDGICSLMKVDGVNKKNE